jgi:hypothetical protein
MTPYFHCLKGGDCSWGIPSYSNPPSSLALFYNFSLQRFLVEFFPIGNLNIHQKPDINRRGRCFKVIMKLKAKLRKALSGKPRSSIISTVPDADAFLHSEPLENVHHRPSRAFTTLPSRLHKLDAQTVESAKLFSTEMMSSISQLRSDLPCLGSSVGHMSSVLYPECLPERLDAVAMILEGATIYDGTNINLHFWFLPLWDQQG